MIRRPFSLPIAVALAAVALAGCGNAARPAAPPPGSPENPLAAVTPDPQTSGGSARGGAAAGGEPAQRGPAEDPGYKALLEQQSDEPQHRFTPCNLVTAREAREIVGKPVEDPFEAPQGPTCIYQPRSGGDLIAVAVQETGLAQLKRHVDGLRRVAVSDRSAYCGTYGQPVLYLPIDEQRVLSVNAECDVARGFAVKALPHL